LPYYLIVRAKIQKKLKKEAAALTH
jgi:hypothetical protein